VLLCALITFLLLAVYRANKQYMAGMLATDRQKDELLSIVSHQLATPISTIRYLLEMFQDGDFGKVTVKQSEQLTKLQTAVSSASELVRMILDVSRIQMGKMQVNRSSCNMEVLLDTIIDIVQPRITEKNIKLVTTITRPMPDMYLDTRLMRMAIENIVTNAIKYTNKNGTIWLEASIKGNKFYCKVTDTGLGVPENEQGMLFNKLFRASNARETTPGTGFGLYVSKGALEAQGGSIRFESKEGKGTTFYIEVPIQEEV
jgi:two-component system, OmpR family, phosphate regulon sensor histidine kinase PhoR